MEDIIVYENGELELKVSVNSETVWLNRQQLSNLFDRDVKTIGKHINNVFREKELDKYSAVANFATTATDGKIYDVEYYNLENDIQDIKSHIKNNTLELNQGIFYNGQIYDAYAFVNDLLKSAKVSITLIDNYINDSVLTLFSKYPKITFKIITSNISKQLKLDINKYNSQYNNLEIIINKTYHDRFITIDDKDLYHLGASLKDLGKKVFAFNKMDIKII